MTPLPSLPPNLDPNCINCGVISAVTSQLNANNFGQLAVSQVQTVTAGATSQITAATTQVNVATETTKLLIEQAIPDTLVDQIIEQYTPVGGVANIKCVADELNTLYNKLNEANNRRIDANQLPPVTIGGLLEILIPPIPVPDIPSPVEIKEYIFEVIERKKRAQRDALVRAQLIKAGEIENV